MISHPLLPWGCFTTFHQRVLWTQKSITLHRKRSQEKKHERSFLKGIKPSFYFFSFSLIKQQTDRHTYLVLLFVFGLILSIVVMTSLRTILCCPHYCRLACPAVCLTLSVLCQRFHHHVFVTHYWFFDVFVSRFPLSKIKQSSQLTKKRKKNQKISSQLVKAVDEWRRAKKRLSGICVHHWRTAFIQCLEPINLCLQHPVSAVNSSSVCIFQEKNKSTPKVLSEGFLK